MTADLPAWIPAEAGMPPSLPVTEGRAGRVVVLLSSEGALAAGWAGAVAVDLADGWSKRGARVVLVDAGLSTPLLHDALGIPNAEGLVDALRWGASVKRVIQRPEGRGFLVLTAGTAVADASAVMALPRWHALCAGFREAGVTLVVLVPSWEEALDAVLAEADGIVVLADPDDEVGELAQAFGTPVLAVTGRAAGEEPDTAEGALADAGAGHPPEGEAGDEADGPPREDPAGDTDVLVEEVEEVSGWGGLADDGAPPFMDAGSASTSEIGDATEAAWDPMSDEEAPPDAAADPDDVFGGMSELDLVPEGDGSSALPAAEDGEGEEPGEVDVDPIGGDAVGADTTTSEVAEAEDDFVLPDPIPVPPSLEEIVEESETPSKRGRAGMLLLLLLIVAAGIAVAAWLGYVDIPGLTPGSGTASAAPVSAPAAVAPTPATVTSPVQEYSLALGAYQDGVVAGQRVVALGTAVPGVQFQSVPVEVDGTLFHRVMAGPARDSAALAALAAHIAETASLDPSGWVPRRTPLAFQLGEMPDLAAAARRVGVLNGLGVSAYVLAVDYSDGSTRYRVFAGAFADEAEASYFSGFLDERGLSSATLSDRTGRLPE